MDCIIVSCAKPTKAHGLCDAHYTKLRRYGDPLAGRHSRPKGSAPLSCSIVDCKRRAVGQGYCGAHYARFRSHGDPLGGAPPRKAFPAISAEHLKRLYEEADSVSALARELGTPTNLTRYHLRTVGVTIRDRGWHSPKSTPPLTMQDSPNWHGGRQRTAKGYILVYVPDHPSRVGRPTGRAYVFEQRLVMERMLGRPLLRTEHVHHLNGIRDDNRPENLELWKGKDPPGVRPHQDQHCPTCTCFHP